jgi:hypothetical protein
MECAQGKTNATTHNHGNGKRWFGHGQQEWDPPMAAESIGYPQPACSTEGKHGRPDYTQGAPVILLSCRGSCVIQLSIALTKYLGKST